MASSYTKQENPKRSFPQGRLDELNLHEWMHLLHNSQLFLQARVWTRLSDLGLSQDGLTSLPSGESRRCRICRQEYQVMGSTSRDFPPNRSLSLGPGPVSNLVIHKIMNQS
ncbi:hypothetical protein RRG08_017926 [Elysia crispata]|uniref:Uncharacterized protein n=1 Tax=Elysia crispata TaxID=231223 RepID=A0AAE1A9L7_9GAST|nr:hypothetical protein RRG08_017926 [Elysia crispata]